MNFQALLLFYGIVVILPVVFWLWFFRRQDKIDPEPRSLLTKLFRLGFIAMFFAFLIEVVVDGALGIDQISERYAADGSPIFDGVFALILLSFFLAGPIEELMKYLILKRSIYKNSHFNQVGDGIIYGVTLALGFSFIENSGYFIDLYYSLESKDFMIITMIRGISTTLLHVSVTGLTGLYIGLDRFSKDKKRNLSLWGVALASIFHGIYNIIVFHPLGIWLNLALVLSILLFLVWEMHRKKVLKVWYKDPDV